MTVGELMGQLVYYPNDAPVAILIFDRLIGVVEVYSEHSIDGGRIATIVAMNDEEEDDGKIDQ